MIIKMECSLNAKNVNKDKIKSDVYISKKKIELFHKKIEVLRNKYL